MEMSTSRGVGNLWSEAVAGVNSRLAVMTEEEILQMLTFLERVVLSPSLYMLIQFSVISVNSVF